MQSIVSNTLIRELRRSSFSPKTPRNSLKRNSILKQLRRSFQLSPNETHPIYTNTEINAYKQRKKTLDDFYNSVKVPKWYRGMSTFQMNACNRLHTALSDDAFEGSTHRTQAILTQIGVTPIVSAKDINILLKLSRCNDLAFLYFTMQLCYATPNEEYTLNEQLLYSSIAYLDTYPTLLEIKRVLPATQRPTKTSKVSPRSPLEVASLRRFTSLHQNFVATDYYAVRRPVKFSPYFVEYLPKKEKPNTKKFIANEPPFKIHMNQLNAYDRFDQSTDDPHWFSDYKPRESKRIVKGVLNQEINTVLDNFSKLKIESEKIDILCEHHKVYQKLKKSFKKQLNEIANREYENQFSTSVQEHERTRQRVVERLHKDVKNYMKIYNQMIDKYRKQTILKILSTDVINIERVGKEILSNTINSVNFDMDRCANRTGFICISNFDTSEQESSEHDDTDDDISNIDVTQSRISQLLSNGCCFFACDNNEYNSNSYIDNNYNSNSKTHKSHNISTNNKSVPSININEAPNIYEYDFKSMGDLELSTQDSLTKQRTKVPFDHGRHDVYNPAQQLHHNEYVHNNIKFPSSSSSNKFFEVNSKNIPYAFDYHKIFDIKCQSPSAINIKKKFIEAVDSDLHLLNNLLQSELNLNKAINNSTKKMLDNTMLKQCNSYDYFDNPYGEKLFEDDIFHYTAPYYDPNDSKLMDQLLIDALNHIKKDPKHILASLPDAYKLPNLQLYIRKHFNKIYTQKERELSLKKTTTLLKNAQRTVLRSINLPSKLALPPNLPYSKRNKLFTYSECFKKRFYKKRNDEIMKNTRKIWFLMAPHLCRKGPPTNTFFAYMPAHIKDIQQSNIYTQGDRVPYDMWVKKQFETKEAIKAKCGRF